MTPDATGRQIARESRECTTARWPTFLVLGAGRAGTTALHGYLVAHPQICIPETKEPNFFALQVMGIELTGPNAAPNADKVWGGSVSSREEYRALFADQDGADHLAFGECSPVYLCIEPVAEAIHQAIPDARLVAMLRDPVDRAISHHAHNRMIGVEPEPDFERAVEIDDQTGGWQYTRHAEYAKLLTHYLNRFDRDQLLLLDHRELAADPEALINRVYDHIGVSHLDPIPNIPRVLQTRPDRVPDWVRAKFAMRFRDDTRRLIDEIGFKHAIAWSTST